MLIHGNCFDYFSGMEDGSVDMILTDPPYGLTDIAWDFGIDIDAFFQHCNRVIKPNGAIVVTAQQPFATDCIVANRKYFRYEWIWEKTQSMGFLNAKKMPLRAHENVLVFYKSLPTYNPQKFEKKDPRFRIGEVHSKCKIEKQSEHYQSHSPTCYVETGLRYPRSVIKFPNWNRSLFGKPQKNATQHPTQKPLALFEYLIRTYTNEGDTVFDPFAGSGTTAVAACNTGRKYIVVEQDERYCEIIRNRISETEQTLFNTLA